MPISALSLLMDHGPDQLPESCVLRCSALPRVPKLQLGNAGKSRDDSCPLMGVFLSSLRITGQDFATAKQPGGCRR